MPKSYKAVTSIKHGMPDGQTVTFEVGDTVTGLSKEAMKELWDAGALAADDGTTSDALQPDLSKEVREDVNPKDKSVEEIESSAPDGGKVTEPVKTEKSDKAAPVAKPTTTSTTKAGLAAPKPE